VEAAAIASAGRPPQDLSRSQLVMIGLGRGDRTGLFMGAASRSLRRPAVILSYAIAAIAAVAMVFSLSEMAVMHPDRRSFGTYAEIYLRPRVTRALAVAAPSS